MPCWAACPVPTMMATGVARPKAQGQEITSTAMAMERQKRTSMPPHEGPQQGRRQGDGHDRRHEDALMRSASREMGALEEAASSMSRMIWERVVSPPTRVARSSK